MISVPSLIVVVVKFTDGARSCRILPVSVAPVLCRISESRTSTGAGVSIAVRPITRVPVTVIDSSSRAWRVRSTVALAPDATRTSFCAALPKPGKSADTV